MTARPPKKPSRAGNLSIIPAAAAFDPTLGKAALRVLCALGAFANRQGKCWPATTTLAAELGISDRRVRVCLRELEASGYIDTEPRPGQRSTYSILRKSLDPGTVASGVEPDPGTPASGGAEHQHPGTPEHQHPPNGVTNVTMNDIPPAGGFDEFWRAYPSRRPHSNPKKPAKKKYGAAIRRGVPPADIIRGANNYALYVEREGTDPKYVAQAQTWLSQERWAQSQEAAVIEPTPIML